MQVLAIDDTRYGAVGEVRLTDETMDGIRLRRLSYHLDQTWETGAEYNNPVVYVTVSQLLRKSRADLFHLISGLRMTGSAVHAAHAQQVPAVVTLMDYWFLCPRIILLRRTGEVCPVPEDPAECALCLLNEQRRYRLPHVATKGLTTSLLKRIWRATDWMGATRVQPPRQQIVGRRQFLGKTLALFDRVIAPSRFLADLYQRHGVAKEQIALIRQGVNIRPPDQDDTYRPHHPLVFGYAGQLASHKGVDLLVKAFRQLGQDENSIRLVLYGNQAQAWPPFLEKLKREIGDDPRIVWGKPFANTDAHKVYTELDLLVVPSIWYENSPNVILEAFACGTPVMTADLGGMAELVTHGVNGYLFAPNSVSSLREALERIISQPQQLVVWRQQIPPTRSMDDEMLEVERIYEEMLR